jgi:hypothetical protein
MDWVCPECDRRYEEPPEACVCGGQPVPEGTPTSTDRLSLVAENLYRSLFDPESTDRNLLRGGPYLRLAFRIVVAVSTLLLLVIALGVVVDILS